jgi:hypothetical protein
MRRQYLAALTLVLATAAAAQTPQFDVVSIKPSDPDAMGSRAQTLPDATGRTVSS